MFGIQPKTLRRLFLFTVLTCAVTTRSQAENVVINGRTYEQVLFGSFDATSVDMNYKGGKMRVPFDDLPPAIQQRYHYVKATDPGASGVGRARNNSGMPLTDAVDRLKNAQAGEIFCVQFAWVTGDPPLGKDSHRLTLHGHPEGELDVEYDDAAVKQVTEWLKEKPEWDKFEKKLADWRKNSTKRYRIVLPDGSYRTVEDKTPQPRPPHSTERIVYAEVLKTGRGHSLKLLGTAVGAVLTDRTVYKW